MTINSLTGGLLLRWGERGGENIEVAGSRWIPAWAAGRCALLKNKNLKQSIHNKQRVTQSGPMLHTPYSS